MFTILLVVEEVQTRIELKNVMTSLYHNITVIETSEVTEALDVIDKLKIDLFILDIQLDDESGVDLAKKIRLILEYELVHIVFIMAVSSRKQATLKDFHSYDYIIKPYDTNEVKKTVEDLI